MRSGPTPGGEFGSAVVLAAGESSRFWPLSANQHKSLFRLGGVSLLERTIRSLIGAGVHDIVVVQSPRSLYAAAGDAVLPSDCLPQEYRGARLTFVEQPEPAGQGDAIIRSADLVGDYFFVVQPENINAGDVARELARAFTPGDLAVVAGQRRADFSLYAVIEHSGQRLTGITEKPATASSARPLCSTGVYLFHSEFVGHLAKFEPDPISIVLAIDELGKAGNVSVAASRNEFLPLKYPGHLWAYARYLGLGSAAAPQGSHADLHECIVSEGCTVGGEVRLHNAILAPGVVIGSGTVITNGGPWRDLDAVVIGQDATIGTNVTIAPRVRIGTGARIASGATIDSDVADLTAVSS